MKILIVCSGNKKFIAPFIKEQGDSLIKNGLEVEYFLISGKGFKGYLKNYFPYLSKLRSFKPDIVHAHYGLSGLFANLQRKVPVVTTFHGSDINLASVLKFSRIAYKLSQKNILVSQRNLAISGFDKNKADVLPCGVDTEIFFPMDKNEARKKIGLSLDGKYALFSSSFANSVKNYPLAKQAIDIVNSVELIELRGYKREEVALLMNACDLVLMTSHTEGSPQFIKEALACNCPIVSVDVGDVQELIGTASLSYVVESNPSSLAEKIKYILAKNERSNGCELIGNYEINVIAKKLNDIYTNGLLKK